MCGHTYDELNARFGERLAFMRYGMRRTNRHTGGVVVSGTIQSESESADLFAGTRKFSLDGK
jgi:hypothetical protein